jgi:diphthamide synthase (EF-2-diphthine--ammonia ligase)
MEEGLEALSREFIRLGFRAVITCVDSQGLDGRFSGREFDEQFLADLPARVDPCGENGEFHSFVYYGPIFKEPVKFKKGGTVVRDNRFYFCELVTG